MTRLLHVSGDHELAKRTLRLYAQIVKKARETGSTNTDEEASEASTRAETDAYWVETLVQGARMLCRIPGGLEEVREAADFVFLARERLALLDDEHGASVDLADGICKLMLAIRGMRLPRNFEQSFTPHFFSCRARAEDSSSLLCGVYPTSDGIHRKAPNSCCLLSYRTCPFSTCA